MSDIGERLAQVKERLRVAAERAGRNPEDVRLVAVSKRHPVDAIDRAFEAGQLDFGENYAQELSSKRQAAKCGDRAAWHYIGHLQRNKVRLLAGRVSCIHSVDRLRLADEIARRAPGMAVYAQVNVSGEPQKGGCPPEEADHLVAAMAELDLEVRGLMTVATAGGDARAEFDRLAALADRIGVTGLSMGMSSDYPQAVAAGATTLRLGTTLFGPRPP